MSFSLVQRLAVNEHPGANQKGFDRYFRLDYMGSSEFEAGAVQQSLQRLRINPLAEVDLDVTVRHPPPHSQAGSEDLAPEKVARLYFIGTFDGVAHAAEICAAIEAERRVFLEPLYLTEEVLGHWSWGKPFTHRIDAWWALDGDVLFGLTPEMRDRLRGAIAPSTPRPDMP
jgi:hypothetical protein